MQDTISYLRLDNHIEHNYNKLLSWYLTHLKNGEFEQLTQNKTRSKQLEVFLNTQFQDFGYDSDKVFLIASVPSSITPAVAAKILPDLLLKVYHAEGCERPEIVITPVGQSSNSGEYLYIVRNMADNFETKSQLSFGVASKNTELNSIISGESGYTPSVQNPQSEISSINSYEPSSEESLTAKNVLTRVPTTQNVITPQSTSQSPMVLVRTKTSGQSSCATTKEERQEDGDDEDNAWNGGEDDGDDDECGEHSVLSSVSSHSSQNSSYIESTDNLRLYPSIVTTNTSIGTNVLYNLMLYSILFIDVEDGLRSTAIRQVSDNATVSALDPDDEDIDDWLLYDSEFSMNNLQLLNFDEVIESTHHTEKVLFYSMVTTHVNSSHYEIDEDEEYDANDLTVVEFNGIDSTTSRNDSSGRNDYSIDPFQLSEYDDNQIRYIQSNGTGITSSIDLSKQTTKGSSRTNFGSVKSELNLIYRADTIFSHIKRSKSTPVSVPKSSKGKKGNHDKTSCVIM